MKDLEYAQRRIAQLEADNAKACQIIKAGFELGTITQADLDWAQHALEGK